MRTYSTTIYFFNELSKKAQQKALDNCRDINTEFSDWSEFVKGNFIQSMNEYGIETTQIYFTGFCCQGDGAMFEGNVNDWDTLSKRFNISSGIMKLINDFGGTSYGWRQSGHYYHEYSIDFNDCDLLDIVSHIESNLNIKPDDFKNIENAFVKLSEQIKDFVTSQSRELYKRLEEEHDSLSSDEAVKETILSNEWEFSKDGVKE